MLKLLILPLLLAFAFTAAAENWTVLVYLAADNNLWQNAVQDINDMESVAIPANLNLIVQSDMPSDSPYPGGQRRRIQQDNSPLITSPLLQNLGSINSGDPQTLNSFINWGFQHYPASRKMVVIWGHGDNWFKSDTPKWICPDDGAQSLISVADGELKAALEDIPRLDILLFDACSMQSVEVLAEVMDVADYVVGSAELVPAAGFPYQTMIPLFAENSVEEISALIPQKYLESYEPGGIQNPQGFINPLTCSTIRTSPLPGFFNLFSDIFCLGGVGEAEAIVENIRGNLWEMNTAYCDVDVEEFMVSCWAMYPQHEVSFWINLTWGRWYECVAWSGSANIPHSPVGSAAIWFPWHRQYFDAWWRKYSKLEFAKTRWLAFLNFGLGDEVPPDPPQLTAPTMVLGNLTFRIIQPLDPDVLSYEVTVQEDNATDPAVYTYTADYGQEGFWVSIPVVSSGSISVMAIDSCGNRSVPVELSFTYEEPGLTVLMVPNPVRARSLASVRWYLPEGMTGEVKLTLYNLRGQMVLSRSFDQQNSGEGSWMLSSEPEFHQLGRGVYILRLEIGKRHHHRKLTIL